MFRLLALGLVAYAGYSYYTRSKSSVPEVSFAKTTRGPEFASTAYGAGSASLTPPTRPMASTLYSAGSASLPPDQVVIP